MRIGILTTGRVNPELARRHGQYPEMFARLLTGAEPALRTVPYWVVEGELPEDPASCDAWLVTGSRHGVYDPLPWIPRLAEFLRAARKRGVPLVGVCFGHQIMAEAFGGRAEKSHRGWGVGVHDYEVVAKPGWMADAPDRIAIHALHQDQVTAIPEDATVLARSDFCPHAMLAYGDPELPEAISIQPHPEFTADYARGLLERRIGDVIPPEVGKPALATLDREVASEDFARWCARYLARARAARAAA